MKNNKANMESLESKIDKIILERFESVVELYRNMGISDQDIKEKISFLLKNGYELADVVLMCKKYPDFIKYDIKRNLSGLSYLQELGFTKQEILDLTKNNPIILILSERYSRIFADNPLSEENRSKENYAKLLYNDAVKKDTMINKLEKEVGYNTEEAIRINDYFTFDAELFKLLSNYPEHFNNVINKLIDFGYTKEEALKVTSGYPKMLEVTDNYKKGIIDIPKVIDIFGKIGYKKEDIIKMTTNSPTVLKVTKEDIRDVFVFLRSEGFSVEEIKAMTSGYPEIFEIANNIKTVDNIFLYEDPKLFESLRFLPKKLEKDYNKTYSRYMYLKENNYPITRENFKLLFGSDHDFIIKYGISDKLLSEMYSSTEQTKKVLKFVLQPEKINRKTK